MFLRKCVLYWQVNNTANLVFMTSQKYLKDYYLNSYWPVNTFEGRLNRFGGCRRLRLLLVYSP